MTRTNAIHGARPEPVTDFISQETEAILLREIEAAMEAVPVAPVHGYNGRSRVLRFGWDYDKPDVWLSDIPGWLVALAPRLLPFNNVSVNQYQAGDEIPPHIDTMAFHGPIQILSLKSPAVMHFKRKCCAVPFSVALCPRSLITLEGDYRINWYHSIVAVPSERFSIVFRRRNEK